MIRFGRLLKSFLYAWRGLVKIFREEQNLRIQSLVALLIIIFAIYFQLKREDWVILVVMIGLVILAEVYNSAMERIADVLKPRINSYVKEIKDIMAAAVVVASITSIIVGIVIFWPYIFRQ